MGIPKNSAAILLIGLVCLVVACSGVPMPQSVRNMISTPAVPPPGEGASVEAQATPETGPDLAAGGKQRGTACWYGRRWHGRRTASGERFNRHSLTAAHRTLPFGTRVKVRNVANDCEVVVRITDRGPWYRDRIIDLSEAAARALGMKECGLAEVEIEVIADSSPDGS